MMAQILLWWHLVGVISWMAGLFYLYRLFVYHSNETHAVVKERLQSWEFRLYYIITVPAMLIAIGCGGGLLYVHSYLLREHWMHAKLFGVFLLVGFTHMGGGLIKKFAAERVTKSHTYFRVLNEVPAILMIIIVGLVILRPF